ncbi:hypothetical protein H9P43_002475 [Blastocladiella emersonii ATCC 22665]|nr:hypothetical protein H9P43_002475 [Blastocladiella emersonii ATCC 22665]
MDNSNGSDTNGSSNGSTGFRVPSALLRSSQARLSKVRALKDERAEQAPAAVAAAPDPAPVAKQAAAAQRSMLPKRAPAAATKPAPSPKPAEATTASAPTATSSSTVSEIERIREARERRRQHMERVRESRAGKDAVDLANEAYAAQMAKFRGVWMQWVEKWKGKAAADLASWDVPIQVCVRKRPVSKKEMEKRALDIVTMTTACYPNASVFVHEPKVGLDSSRTVATQAFHVDKVYDEHAGNDFIYQSTLATAIPKLMAGENVSLFAYGATGSGKTHTVFGPNGGKTAAKSAAHVGLYEYACGHVFDMIRDQPVDAYVSFLEIYSGRVFDLLNGRQPVKLLEQNGNFYFQGLREYPVPTLAACAGVMRQGMATRTTGSTESNNTSSRSHAIFRLELRPRGAPAPSSTAMGNTSSDNYPVLSLIDLAGSERGVDNPNASSERRREGAAINQSLLALKECIRSLHVQSAYVPYRSSKLTCVLRDCFRGNGGTCIMILNIAPTSATVEQTLSCLHYANRVKEYSHGTGAGAPGSADELIAQLAAAAPSPVEESAAAAVGGEPVWTESAGESSVEEDDDLPAASDGEEADGGEYADDMDPDSSAMSHPQTEGDELGYESEASILDTYGDGDAADESVMQQPQQPQEDEGESTPLPLRSQRYASAASSESMVISTAGSAETVTPQSSTGTLRRLATSVTAAAVKSLLPQPMAPAAPPAKTAASFTDQDLMELHVRTLHAVLDLSKEEEALVDDAARGKLAGPVYAEALEVLVDDKLRRLLKLKAMVQVVRQHHAHGDVLDSPPPPGGTARDRVRAMRRGAAPS